MVGLTELWLPILLSAVLVFVVSSIIHMVLGYHKNDWVKIPGEEMVMDTIRKAGVPPGDYMFPHCGSMKDLKSKETIEKFTRGPIGVTTIFPSGPPTMTKELVLWFLYTIVAGIFVAYVTGRTRAPGAEYLAVFQIAGATAFLTYAGGAPADSIWKHRKWSTTIKFVVDGLLYALVTAGTFGWLWPGP